LSPVYFGRVTARIVEENELELVKSLILNFKDLYDLDKLEKYTDLEKEKLKEIILTLLERKELFGTLEEEFFLPDPYIDQ
jgi:non-homologous end joining protein Ku